MGLTGTTIGKTMTGNWNASLQKFIEFLKYVPGIGSLIYFSEGISLLSSGNTSQALLKFIVGLSQLIPGVGSLVAFFEKKVSAKLDKTPTKSLSDILAESMLKQFETYPSWMKWILKRMGIPIANVEDIFPSKSAAYYKRQRILEEEEGIIKPTQALITSKTSPKITFQPAQEDKLYTMGEQDIYAKKDDILGKTFEDIKKQLTNLNKAFDKSVHILNDHTKIFESIMRLNKNQLDMLPNLIPAPVKNEQTIPSSDVRDPVYAYRSRIHDQLQGRI
jgi:hypothetical protein